MSISATVVSLLLILWRSLTKKYIPYKFYYLLWGTLFFRLAIPISLRSVFSAFNLLSKVVDSSAGGSYVVTMEYIDVRELEEATATIIENRLLNLISILWLCISIGLICWWLFLYFKAKERLKYSILNKDKLNESVRQTLNINRKFTVHISDRVQSPVILGFIHPKIVMPQDIRLTSTEKECVLAHEMVHIKRSDQFIKAAMFFISAFHWYNPVVWMCFYLFNEDIETSCDQEVLASYGIIHKKEYATALVDCADKSNNFRMGYLAFAQSKVTARVAKVLTYKRMSNFKIVVFSIATLFIGLCVSTNPILQESYTYIPKSVYLSKNARTRINEFANGFIADLEQGNLQQILQKSTADTEYFLPLYCVFEKEKISATIDRIFYTSKNSAIVYLQMKNQNSLFPPNTQNIVLEISDREVMQGLYAESIHTYAAYENINKIDYSNEAVMLCEKMIKYGLTSGENTPENAENIVLFCMDIAYERQKNKATTLIESNSVENIATEFFRITDFTNLKNTAYYEPQKEVYHYDKSRGQYFEFQIIDLELTKSGAAVTAEFYKDPLQIQKEKVVKYIFEKV